MRNNPVSLEIYLSNLPAFKQNSIAAVHTFLEYTFFSNEISKSSWILHKFIQGTQVNATAIITVIVLIIKMIKKILEIISSRMQEFFQRSS